jgi:hypothetical protein
LYNLLLKLTNFFDKPQGSATRNVKASLDTINANIKWMSSGFPTLNTWLTDNIVVVKPEMIDCRLPKDFHYDI